jgi:hypothetical protein
MPLEPADLFRVGVEPGVGAHLGDRPTTPWWYVVGEEVTGVVDAYPAALVAAVGDLFEHLPLPAGQVVEHVQQVGQVPGPDVGEPVGAVEGVAGQPAHPR